MMDSQTKSDLEGTLAIAERDWVRNGHCLQICVMSHANGREQRYGDFNEALEKRTLKVFQAMGFEDLWAGWAWNDQPERTKDDVVWRIREALVGTLEEVSVEVSA